MIGKTIRNYHIIEELGQGSLGIVYLAEHKVLSSKYTVKELYPNLAKNEHYRDRFVKIAQAQAMLKHPNIVKVLDFIAEDGQYFLISEYIDGPSLENYLKLRKNRICFDEIITAMEGPLEALNYIHSKGIIHRNIKPSNIIFDSSMKGYLTDLCSAKVLGDRSTRVSINISSPFYISPEMSLNNDVDHRSDIYSIGCVLYEMATGKPPYEGETNFQIYQKHQSEPIPLRDLYDTSLPQHFIDLIEKALEKNPDNRLSGCGEMLEILKSQNAKKHSTKKMKEVSQKKSQESQQLSVEEENSTQSDEVQHPFRIVKKGKGLCIITVILVLIFILCFVLKNNKGKTLKEMADIPAGCFKMGANKGSGDHDEYPNHQVRISAFKIDKCEVTNEEYRKCVEASVCRALKVKSSTTRTSYYSNSSYDSYPVIYVSWNDAKRYCEWAGKRLPTEAEWEYAARGGIDSQIFPWGDEADKSKANYNSNDTAEVGSYNPNSYELYDMSGNVWEWVNDWYDEDYYKNSPSFDPKGPSDGIDKVVRGGGWYGKSINIRSANRLNFPPETKSFHIGFRCVK